MKPVDDEIDLLIVQTLAEFLNRPKGKPCECKANGDMRDALERITTFYIDKDGKTGARCVEIAQEALATLPPAGETESDHGDQ